MIKIFNRNKTKNGYAVLELIFYVVFFAVLSLVVIDAMITMAKSFKETSIQAEFIRSGNILERISREIRQANSIDATSTSTDLKLNTTSGADTKIEFKLSGSNLQLIENNVLTGNLNTPDITITALAFTQITTAKSKAVRIILTIKSANDILGRTQDFNDTVVLRGSYQ